MSKILPFFFLFLFCASGCKQITESKYNGKWILQDQDYHEDIILKDGNYTKKYTNDDLRGISSGKFYLNRNEKRTGTTLSLIPDKIISEKDTIFEDCENLDVIAINDSTLKILKANQWTRNKMDKFISINEILTYKKAVR